MRIPSLPKGSNPLPSALGLAGATLSKASKTLGKAKSTATQAGKKAKQLLSPNGLMRQARAGSARNDSKAFELAQRGKTPSPAKSNAKSLATRTLDRPQTSASKGQSPIESFLPGKQAGSRPIDSNLKLEGWELGSEALLKAAGLAELIDVPFLKSTDLTDQQANAIRGALQSATVGNANNISKEATVFVLMPSGELSKANDAKQLAALPPGSTVISTNETGASLLKGKKALGLEPGAFAFEVANKLGELFGQAANQSGGPAAQCERML